MEYVIVFLYCLALLLIFAFSMGQLHLTWHFLRKKYRGAARHNPPQAVAETELPAITVQLPIYNERYVVERLIDAVGAFDYPREKLEIQVLDDSTDETVRLIAQRVDMLKAKGINISHIRRKDRKGFKAGALAYGLTIAKGDFIAIFDADFIPKPSFLRDTIPHFDDIGVGMVQTRWGHINKDYSMLTKLQAFGLDAHFSVEQSGRNAAGSFINFNGTAGVWRKKCILDAGGWSDDTLTEDLDLSYRAQMKHWRFKYLEDIVAPAELPVIMPAIKSQQYRWNKGAAETAKKHLAQVITSGVKGSSKVHAVFHLLNSSVFVCLLLASILSIPMLFIKESNPKLDFLFNLGSIFLLGFFSIAFFYWVAAKRIHPQKTARYFFSVFPVFLTVSMGLSLHNALAVLEGLFGFKSPFVRTPKFNIKNKEDRWEGNIYIKPTISLLTLLEGVLALYFIFGILAGFFLGDLGLLVFHVMLSAGFASVFYHSVKPVKHA